MLVVRHWKYCACAALFGLGGRRAVGLAEGFPPFRSTMVGTQLGDRCDYRRWHHGKRDNRQRLSGAVEGPQGGNKNDGCCASPPQQDVAEVAVNLLRDGSPQAPPCSVTMVMIHRINYGHTHSLLEDIHTIPTFVTS